MPLLEEVHDKARPLRSAVQGEILLSLRKAVHDVDSIAPRAVHERDKVKGHLTTTKFGAAKHRLLQMGFMVHFKI